MLFEVFIIVKVLEWRRRRDEATQLRPFRQRTRNFLRSRVIDASARLLSLAESMAQSRLNPPIEGDATLSSPAPR